MRELSLSVARDLFGGCRGLGSCLGFWFWDGGAGCWQPVEIGYLSGHDFVWRAGSGGKRLVRDICIRRAMLLAAGKNGHFSWYEICLESMEWYLAAGL